jgi:hypothetical protein
VQKDRNEKQRPWKSFVGVSKFNGKKDSKTTKNVMAKKGSVVREAQILELSLADKVTRKELVSVMALHFLESRIFVLVQ